MCLGGSLLRGGDYDNALANLKSIDWKAGHGTKSKYLSRMFKNAYDVNHSIKLISDLKKMQDFDLRIETPYISVYTNNIKNINFLEKKYYDQIRYICKPDAPDSLEADVVIMPKLKGFDYKITLAATRQEHSAFVAWAENNPKIRITKSAKRELLRSRSWGGTHFYVVGENNLLMAKMHLSTSIGKIQRIAK